jgi:hypothetical protein
MAFFVRLKFDNWKALSVKVESFSLQKLGGKKW